MNSASDLYQAFFHAIGESVFIVDIESERILDANPQAARLTGLPAEALQNLSYKALFQFPGTAETCCGSRLACELCFIAKVGGAVGTAFDAFCIDCQAGKYLVLIARASDDGTVSAYSYLGTGDQVWAELKDFPNIIGQSEKIRDVCRLIGSVAKTDATVLIQGESGTGKEVVANAIHVHSLRANHPFVKVNCAALSETLLESELFGHVKGAFTGAIRDRRGRFQQANGGTILLDEIGCMSLAGQAKLLRVLQEHEFEPVGSSVTLPVNVRVLASTNVDLAAAVKQGKFREDLYYRLNVFSIPLPPLRERKQDIQLLAQHFLYRNNVNLGKSIDAIAPATYTLLMQHDWPGNIRELENVIEHAAIVEQNHIIAPGSLPINLAGLKSAGADNDKEYAAFNGLREKLNALEKQIIFETLQKTNGVKKDTASLLGIDPRNLPYLLRKHRFGH
ncbi:sigma-54 interaction domain-containing protein [Methylomonas sp. 2BW1-5-20]|uniref:sigma-54 interaction domain-containing protein n=1 Tax=Methylomonas sp. 2BW1-5-20 TaxID=3376686 RepID=UPI00404BD82A